jgi:hypothetical protein
MMLQFVVNETARKLAQMFPGFFPEAKHNHYADFGYPKALEFTQFFDMYTRNSIARAAVDKTIAKTWQDMPFLLEKERDGSENGETKESTLEKQIREHFATIRFWRQLAESDRRSLVGAYAGVILRLKDSKKFSEPVDTVSGGLDGLVEIIPAWEGQLTVSTWDTDENSDTYGHPKMFQFAETANNKSTQQPRNFQVHPDRVVVWSRDGTVFNRSMLEPGYNDLLTMEKVTGAGGEGFWKNAKSAPVLQVDKDANVESMAKAMNVPVEKVADAMNAQVEKYQKGFDQLLMVQGIEAKTLGISLPSPEHFFGNPLNCFASSVGMPAKILIGMQTGERASKEDAAEWAQTNMARRANETIPNILLVVNRLVAMNILPKKDYFVDWSDLTEASMQEKIDRAYKMADTNSKMKSEVVFTGDEIRAAVGYEPLSEDEKFRDEIEEEDDADPGAEPKSKAA